MFVVANNKEFDGGSKYTASKAEISNLERSSTDC